MMPLGCCILLTKPERIFSHHLSPPNTLRAILASTISICIENYILQSFYKSQLAFSHNPVDCQKYRNVFSKRPATLSSRKYINIVWHSIDLISFHKTVPYGDLAMNSLIIHKNPISRFSLQHWTTVNFSQETKF